MCVAGNSAEHLLTMEPSLLFLLCNFQIVVVGLVENKLKPAAIVHIPTMSPLSEIQSLDNHECPLWFSYNSEQQKCQCINSDAMLCDNATKAAYVLSCFCVTHNEQQDIVISKCFFNCVVNLNKKSRELHDFVYLKLPENSSDLNHWMCNQWNREGTSCGKCKNDFFPLAYSYDLRCVPCNDNGKNWVKFFSMIFIPSTVFYLLALFFKLNITSSYLHGFVLFSQIVTTPAISRILVSASHRHSDVKFTVYILGTFYGVWNLDFFRFIVPGVCLRVSTLTILALDFVAGIYPITLIILSYFFVVLHHHNVRPVICIGKPLRFLLRLFNRNWDSKTSLIDAYATFFLLSYVKILCVACDLLYPVVADVCTSNSTKCISKALLYYDGTVEYFSVSHLAYVIISTVVLLIFIVTPTVVLLLYPFTWFQRCLFRCHFDAVALKTFVNSFYTCFKDGQQAGTRDCRWFSVMYLMLRIFLFVTVGYFPTGLAFPVSALVLAVFVIVHLLVQPYRPEYVHYGKMDLTFVLILIIGFTSMAGTQIASINAQNMVKLSKTVFIICSLFPTIFFIGLSMYWLVTRRKNVNHIQSAFKAWRQGYGWNELIDSDSLPDRVVHPNTYYGSL